MRSKYIICTQDQTYIGKSFDGGMFQKEVCVLHR